MNAVKNAKHAYMAYSIVLMIAGVLSSIKTAIPLNVLAISAGLILTVCGIIKLLDYFVNDSYGLAFQFDFALGIFTILLGVMILLSPERTVRSIQMLIGTFVLADGAFKLQTAKEARDFGLKTWWLILLLAIGASILGVLLVMNPFNNAIASSIIFGLALLVDGIDNLVVALNTVKLIKRAHKANAEQMD